MLILSRRPGDAILIDGGIRIVVLASGQRSVRLGIEAPAQVGIVREEIASRNDKADPTAKADPEAAPHDATGVVASNDGDGADSAAVSGRPEPPKAHPSAGD